MVGKSLAQYHVTEKLGEGGMGVVWKARDTHLDRFVALKTLSTEKLSDPDRKSRFVQEAKAASALNHPNIVHIYDISEADGVPFIAMEYVAGKTLDQLIGRKGLRTHETLKYAAQIADALAKAHSVSIIHRDLKPSNVMVTENGLVKVLDFGLAKLAETASSEFATTETIKPHTDERTIVGTTAYMSPEQAEGKKVDARSDIFSFGSVLYEMVTGQRAFRGDSKLSTLSAILKDDPKPVSSIAPDVPSELEKIITRCLRKDPDRRFQHMDDLKVALLDLKEESDSGKLIGGQVTKGQRKSRLVWAVAGAVILIFAGVGVTLRFLRPAPRSIPRTIPFTSYPGHQSDPAFSPDGKQVAFAWDGEQGDNLDIYVKLVDAGSPLRLTSNPAAEFSPAWSPDGRYIAFCRSVSAHAEIWMVPALGGAQRKLAEAAYCAGLSWSPDGRFLALTDQTPTEAPFAIFLLNLGTGEKQKVTRPPKEALGDGYPRFSSSGKDLAFVREFLSIRSDIYTVPISGSGPPVAEPRRLTSREDLVTDIDWTADNRKIVFSAGGWNASSSLWSVSATGGTTEPIGLAGEKAMRLSVSPTGHRLVYQSGVLDPNIWRIPGPNAPKSKVEPLKLIASTQADGEPQFSPDGKKIVFSSSRSGNEEIWVCDQDGRSPVQLTSFNGPTAGSPRWSPDGRWISFDVAKGNLDIHVVSADGGAPRQFTSGGSNNGRSSWSRDGRWIYFQSDRSGVSQVWKQTVSGGKAVQISKNGGSEAFESADGKFVYWTRKYEPGVWRIPVAGGEETQVLKQGRTALWALTGRGILFFDLDNPAGPLLNHYNFATQQTTLVRKFRKDTRIGLGPDTDTALSISPDGRWIIYTQVDQGTNNLMLVENFE